MQLGWCERHKKTSAKMTSRNSNRYIKGLMFLMLYDTERKVGPSPMNVPSMFFLAPRVCTRWSSNRQSRIWWLLILREELGKSIAMYKAMLLL